MYLDVIPTEFSIGLVAQYIGGVFGSGIVTTALVLVVSLALGGRVFVMVRRAVSN